MASDPPGSARRRPSRPPLPGPGRPAGPPSPARSAGARRAAGGVVEGADDVEGMRSSTEAAWRRGEVDVRREADAELEVAAVAPARPAACAMAAARRAGAMPPAMPTDRAGWRPGAHHVECLPACRRSHRPLPGAGSNDGLAMPVRSRGPSGCSRKAMPTSRGRGVAARAAARDQPPLALHPSSTSSPTASRTARTRANVLVQRRGGELALHGGEGLLDGPGCQRDGLRGVGCPRSRTSWRTRSRSGPPRGGGTGSRRPCRRCPTAPSQPRPWRSGDRRWPTTSPAPSASSSARSCRRCAAR